MSCNTLSGMFKKALLKADYERALTVYNNTGNIEYREVNKAKERCMTL